MLILGRGEVGKTSLYRQLVGKPHQSEMDRTRGIDSETVHIAERENVHEDWQVLGKFDTSEQFSDALAGELLDRLPERSDKGSTEEVTEADLLAQVQNFSYDENSLATPEPLNIATADVASEDIFESPTEKFDSQDKVASPVHETKSAPQTKPVLLSEPVGMLNSQQSSKLNKILTSKQPYKRKDASVVLNVMDFAGQHTYRPMHHCFITKRGLFIVAFKLPDMLEYIRDPSKAKYNPLSDVCYWIRSIHAHTFSGEEINERVLLVGTRREELPDVRDNLKEIDGFIEQELFSDPKAYTDNIRSLGSDSICSYFIPVENSIDIAARGKSYLEDSGTKLVRDAILSMSAAMPFMNESHPIKWLKFEENLKQRRQACKAASITPILKMQEVKDLAVKSGITDEQQQDLALKFLHDTGKIICMSKSLRN